MWAGGAGRGLVERGGVWWSGAGSGGYAPPPHLQLPPSVPLRQLQREGVRFKAPEPPPPPRTVATGTEAQRNAAVGAASKSVNEVCIMSTVHVHCACSLRMVTVHGHCASCTLCMYTVHGHCACTLCMYTVHGHCACTLCICTVPTRPLTLPLSFPRTCSRSHSLARARSPACPTRPLTLPLSFPRTCSCRSTQRFAGDMAVAFKSIDADGSGKLSRYEISKAMKAWCLRWNGTGGLASAGVKPEP